MLPYLGLLLALGQVSVVQLRPQVETLPPVQNQPDINQPWQVKIVQSGSPDFLGYILNRNELIIKNVCIMK